MGARTRVLGLLGLDLAPAVGYGGGWWGGPHTLPTASPCTTTLPIPNLQASPSPSRGPSPKWPSLSPNWQVPFNSPWQREDQ